MVGRNSAPDPATDCYRLTTLPNQETSPSDEKFWLHKQNARKPGVAVPAIEVTGSIRAAAYYKFRCRLLAKAFSSCDGSLCSV
jgi:hypothetical protein